MKFEEHTYHHIKKLPLKATFYRSSSNTSQKTILYFHGGGLVYGSRTDLPEDYIQAFLDAGYHFLTFDYPLAPESRLDDILSSAKEAIRWFLTEASSTLDVTSSDYILFGRSAGAYLCFLFAKDTSLKSPECLIDFYGYDSLDYREFKTASPFYAKYPQLTESIVDRMIQSRPLAEGPLQTRYALYLYARQTGKWMDFLKVADTQNERFRLTKENLNSLPPTFIAHSTNDPDVPYRIAEKLNNNLPKAHLHSIAGNEHDFDRDSQSETAQTAYAALFDWLLQDK